MASDRMLRGRSPQGLKRAVYLLVCSLAFAIHQYKVVNAFNQGSGDVIKCCVSILDCINALIEQYSNSCYCKRVPIVVVFEISPSHVKTFYYRPNAHNYYYQSYRTLCDVFALALNLNFKNLNLQLSPRTNTKSVFDGH